MYSAVRLVTPPALEPVPIDVLRRHLRIDTLDDDDLLATYLSTARTMAEVFLNRALITQTLRWVTAHEPPASSFPMFPFNAWIYPLWMPYSLLFQRPVELPRSPVQSVASVKVGLWGQDDSTLDASLYDLDISTEPARLKLLQGAGGFPSDHTIVEYVVGYGDSAASIPPPIVHAVMMIVAFLYENRGDEMVEMPEVARSLLWPYRVYTFG